MRHEEIDLEVDKLNSGRYQIMTTTKIRKRTFWVHQIVESVRGVDKEMITVVSYTGDTMPSANQIGGGGKVFHNGWKEVENHYKAISPEIMSEIRQVHIDAAKKAFGVSKRPQAKEYDFNGMTDLKVNKLDGGRLQIMTTTKIRKRTFLVHQIIKGVSGVDKDMITVIAYTGDTMPRAGERGGGGKTFHNGWKEVENNYKAFTPDIMSDIWQIHMDAAIEHFGKNTPSPTKPMKAPEFRGDDQQPHRAPDFDSFGGSRMMERIKSNLVKFSDKIL